MVSARHVIEHIPDPDSFIAEVARILRPAGQACIFIVEVIILHGGGHEFRMSWRRGLRA